MTLTLSANGDDCLFSPCCHSLVCTDNDGDDDDGEDDDGEDDEDNEYEDDDDCLFARVATPWYAPTMIRVTMNLQKHNV